MKFRIKIKDLSMSLNLALEDQEASVQGVKRRVASEVLQRIGLNMFRFSLSLNGRDPLSASVQDCQLSELGVVGGDLLYVLDAQFDPALTRCIPEVVRQRQSLRVETVTLAPADAAAEPEPVPVESDEPLLLRHSRPDRVPRLLTWLAEQSPPDGPDHLLALALHALMLEAGLQPIPVGPEYGISGGFRPSVVGAVPGPAAAHGARTAGYYPGGENGAQTAGYYPGGENGARHWQLPAGWKRPGLFQITYGLHFNMALTAVLTVVPMGNVTVVHTVPTGGDAIMTVSLRPRDYIAATESADTARRFRNLRRLSNVFKNGVTIPLLVHLQRLVGLVSPHEWRALPLELQLLVLRRLAVRDLLRVRCTSREMRSRVDDPLLWKDLVFRDFPIGAQQLVRLGPTVDWKQLYVRLFRQRATAERQSQPPPELLPGLPSQPWLAEPGPALLRPPIAGIVGGEYDRLPSLGFQPPLALPRARLDSMLPAGRRRFGSEPVADPFFAGGRFM